MLQHCSRVPGVLTPVLAKHSKSFSLIDCISVGVDRMQRNVREPMRKQGKSLLYVIRYEQERKGICYQFDSGVAHFKERSPLVVCRSVIPNLPLSEGIGKGRRFLYATQEVIDRAPDRRVVPVVRTGQPRVMRLLQLHREA
jgi:hypothetical protein